MKLKKLLSILLAFALLVTFAAPVGAEGNLFFVAVNDSIPLTLTAQPVTSAGILYVPYTIFDARPGGVYSAYNQTEQTFVLFTRERRLVFDLATGETSDENQTTSTQATLIRNDLLYLPLVFCASHFGLKVSMLESLGGYSVLRFTTGSEVYDDSLFIEKAENLIAYRVAQATAPDPADTPVQQPEQPVQPIDPEPELVPATVYLAFRDAGSMAENAALLAEHQLRAAFFLTEAEIRDNPTLVRDLYAQGHVLGLTVPENSEDIPAALAAANDALDALLSLRVQLALLSSQTDGEGLSGYTLFYESSMDKNVESILEHPEFSHVLLSSSSAAVSLSALHSASANFRLLRETTSFS